MESRNPRVIAVVVNWNREDDTAACLRSLEASDYPRLATLLVDNGSTDGSGDRLRRAFPEVIHLSLDENTGFTGGYNQGMEFALEDGCEYVLLLNNDAVVEPECVSRMVEAAESTTGVGAVGGKILYFDAPDRIWFAGGDFSAVRAAGLHRCEGEKDDSAAGGSPEDVSFLTGCCLLIPTKVLREVGGFQEDFFAYVEDVEFSVRLRSNGYRLLYAPAARLLHRVPRDAAPPTPFKIRLRDRNRRRMVKRRFGRIARMRFGIFFYPTRLVIGVRYAIRGDRARATAVWDGMTDP
jgi:GT2 family glycosyltransferase